MPKELDLGFPNRDRSEIFQKVGRKKIISLHVISYNFFVISRQLFLSGFPNGTFQRCKTNITSFFHKTFLDIAVEFIIALKKEDKSISDDIVIQAQDFSGTSKMSPQSYWQLKRYFITKISIKQHTV